MKKHFLLLLIAIICMTMFGCENEIKDEHIHTYSSEWSYDETNHWHAATCEHVDEKSLVAPHSWDAGVVTTEATDTTTGIRTFTCTICGNTKEQIIPILSDSAPTSIITNGGATIELASLTYQSDAAESVVYYISDISPEALIKIYEALGWNSGENVGIKLSTGEPPASNYLDPLLIKNLVQLVDGTIVECNTAYGGSRSSTAAHYQVAEDHGYTDIANVQILDENGSMTIPVNGGAVLSENYVGAAFDDYDSYIVLSHFKGHSMAGFGGAIKNISIGFGSAQGKRWIHSGGTSLTNLWGGEQNAFCEAMADAGKSVSDYMNNGENIIYINVMNNLSIDCDCNGHPAEPDIHDIGILASTDPVALDQACIDLIWVSEGNETFINRVNNRNGLHTLETGEDIRLGDRHYHLIDITNEIDYISTYISSGVLQDMSMQLNNNDIEVLPIIVAILSVIIVCTFTITYIVKKKKKQLTK